MSNKNLVRARCLHEVEDIQEIIETLNKSKEERKGYILIPSPEGFQLYEIDKERLELYLKAETFHRKHLTLNTREI